MTHRERCGRPAGAVAPLLAGRPGVRPRGRPPLRRGPGFTSPVGFAARSLIALVVEAILAALTIAWLHRSPAPGLQARSTTPDPEPSARC